MQYRFLDSRGLDRHDTLGLYSRWALDSEVGAEMAKERVLDTSTQMIQGLVSSSVS